ncbi:MAG: hypothetical protein JST01_27710 [Cyanobacteria bacterium SZAS TMP-1]|nr:hypothetical protein [Cyanobacteria bacterium SZAS TMP-1]
MQPSPRIVALLTLVIFAGIMVIALSASYGLDYYTSEILNWDAHKQRLVMYSGAAVLWAGLLLLWVRAAEKKTPEELARDNPGSNIIDMAGWTMLCLALTFSEGHQDWHIIREFYFGLGFIAGLTIVYSYLYKYKRTTGGNRKRASLLGLFYLALPILITWKYFSGEQSLF